MPVASAVELFRHAAFRWWLAGGHALDAHLRRCWRAHHDTDIGICRTDAPQLADMVGGWDIHVAAGGVLTPWNGRPLDASRSENNLWCRPSPDAAWALDVTVGDGDDHEWIYRRDRSIHRPWAAAVLQTRSGTPYLAPELQLLFKSPKPRSKDHLDAATVIPELDPSRRAWLAAHLSADHAWQHHLATGRP